MIGTAKADKALGVHRTCAQPHFLYGHVFCAECGAPYTRRTFRNRDGSTYKAWNCRERQKGRKGNGCKNTVIKEDELLLIIGSGMGMEQSAEDRFCGGASLVIVGANGIVLRSREAEAKVAG
jgi:hypothetical protein